MTAFGIDFGTTNCVVAQSASGKSRVLAPDAGSRDSDWMFPSFQYLVPSVFGVAGTGPDQTELFGWAAKLRSEVRIEAVKRAMAEDGAFDLGGRMWSTEAVVTSLFRVLREGVIVDGARIDDAVVTVPANSSGRARLLTRIAAGNANISVAALLNEPTAAALAYAQNEPDVGRVLVYDFGGGTLDVTVLDISDGVFRERASKGVAGLGGIELDSALSKLVLSQLGGHESWSAGERRRFALEVERAKIRLSTDEAVVVYSPDARDGVEIHRTDFELVIDSLVKRTLDPVRRCLDDLQLEASDLDAVLLVGGSSQVPLVRRRTVEELLGRSAVGVDEVNPMTSVAQGASVAAGILAGERDDLIFKVVTEHALGTQAIDPVTRRKKFSTVIPRNRLLPTSETRSYTPLHDFADSMSITVIEGDPLLAVGDPSNVELKTFDFPLTPPRTKEDARFDVEFRYDVSGVVHVTAHDRASGALLLSEEVSWLSDGSGVVAGTPK